jgi:3-methyladenine DNA glycosylase/8-oxoguanine DNA glycosylase
MLFKELDADVTVENLPKDLTDIKGVGKKTAEIIQKAIDELNG